MRVRQVIPVCMVLLSLASVSRAQQDPLPSWNDGPAKRSIVAFVSRVTNPSAADGGWVKPEDRVAVFDNDGTLWCEQPLYFQFMFAMDRVRALAPDHPEWEGEGAVQVPPRR